MRHFQFYLLFASLSIVLLASCATTPRDYSATSTQAKVNYADLDNWAAHPQKTDAADQVPGQSTMADQSSLPVDVFFVHPTTYTGQAIDNNWNAPVNHQKLNDATDERPIKFQASLFNQVGKVYAPRYQQAHIKTYGLKTEKRKQIFDKAYQDVKAAFLYYLKNENDGRPFIIASHSQGTTHCKRLLSEVIDGQKIQSKMVVAYLVGMPVLKDQYQNIPVCQEATQTGCFSTWRTFKHGYTPKEYPIGDSIAVTNPLSWTTDDQLISKDKNLGAILRNFDKPIAQAADAQVHNGILWASKPKFPGSFLFTRKNYHIADYNFYYFNVQQNAQERTQAYLKNNR